MGPYRSSRQADLREPPKEGLVADMVKQFADPFAFLRELVQNSIDAGATRIAVRVAQRPDGAICTSVTDDGCGMTLETIEGPFLTLFASSKEGVDGKIGKYGVGFMSVFGPGPEQVVVSTWRAEGSHVISLERDFSYVVRKDIDRDGHGTSVEQTIVDLANDFQHHADRVALALARWCRHALCPITLDVVDVDGRLVRPAHRIDRPLAIDCPVAVTERNGEQAIVVGYEAGSAFLPGADGFLEGSGMFAGFYNRGLTLYESTQECIPGLDGLRCKLMSPSLQHTLSRDNVRRDEAFATLIRRASKLARESLPGLLESRLAELAAHYAQTSRVPDDYMAVLVAATAHLDRARITLPLVVSVDGCPTMTVARILDATSDSEPCLTGESADDLTRACASRLRPVVRVGPAREIVASLLRPVELMEAAAAYALIAPLPPSDAAETQLMTAVESALDAVGSGVLSASLCTIRGLVPRLAAVLVPADANQQLLASVRELSEWRSRWGKRRRALWLRREDPAVSLALAWARAGEAEMAGCLLARVVLLEWRGTIPARANDILLARSLQAPRIDEARR